MAKIFFGSLNQRASALAVIMAGGSGTRFWPLSRKSLPKQYLSLGSSSRSLIQMTSDRLTPLVGTDGVMVVTALAQKELVQKHLPSAAVLAEPLPRNTCPCAGFAAIKVLQEVGDVPLLCVPADHKIDGMPGIWAVFRKALDVSAGSDALVTIGIRPAGPETGYGYIKAGQPLEDGAVSSYRVDAFVEKPSLAVATEYVSSGRFLWNSGMFAWRPSVLLEAIRRFQPELHEKLMAIKEVFGMEDERERVEEIFRTITPISVDVGVMERADNVVMLTGAGFNWNDVGSWASWVESASSGGEGSDIQCEGSNISKGDALFVDSKNCATISSGRLVAAVGTEDLIIIETPDAVLVCRKDRAQDVKEVVSKLQERQRGDLL